MHCDHEFRNNDPDHRCFIPKAHLHTWEGHTKAVTAIRFLPKTGHVLLSASLDNSIKLWDVNYDGHLLRSFNGHSLGVRDLCFTNDGSRFMSASYDGYVKLWDTETGVCTGRFNSGKRPNMVRIYPENESEFLVSQDSNDIIQWDMRANKISVTYAGHLRPVKTVTFIEGNKQFVSTSTDKRMFVWDYGLPVVNKYMLDAAMQSVKFAAVSPDGSKYIGQTSGGVMVFTIDRNGKFRPTTKSYRGHSCGGYACQVGFSPDGQFVMSGSSNGFAVFWDAKKRKLYSRLKCHDKATVGCIWHPVFPSRVATCSWDGTIKLWD